MHTHRPQTPIKHNRTRRLDGHPQRRFSVQPPLFVSYDKRDYMWTLLINWCAKCELQCVCVLRASVVLLYSRLFRFSSFGWTSLDSVTCIHFRFFSLGSFRFVDQQISKTDLTWTNWSWSDLRALQMQTRPIKFSLVVMDIELDHKRSSGMKRVTKGNKNKIK